MLFLSRASYLLTIYDKEKKLNIFIKRALYFASFTLLNIIYAFIYNTWICLLSEKIQNELVYLVDLYMDV